MKTLTRILPLLGLAFIIMTFALLNTPVFFTYRSKANEDLINTFDRTQGSIEAVHINEDLPSCVSSFLYIPASKNDSHSCLVQFTCATSAVKTFFPHPHFSCTHDGSRFTCAENITQDQEECALIDEWLDEAALTCGCGKS